ncbi:unnamed protein product [Bemisia tabaci]|uniref:Heme haloperoxidase family profile domain-containing protein n=1 Tax=Bemisia tabaci TaxID=7038 RepID=A0A9P0F8T8_BEMTA|nr:unnamed protein product [Bemisia tabaci]
MQCSRTVTIVILAIISRVSSLSFDAERQGISTSGDHKFIAPNFTNGDQRGPCPALNSLSNHGYMSRNGVVSFRESAAACIRVFGLGEDIANLLAIYGALFDGNGTYYSIGGETPLVKTGPSPFNTAKGLSNSHNNYEGDASPTRCDLYLCEEAFLLRLEYFIALYNRKAKNSDAGYDINVFFDHYKARRNNSIFTNPFYFSCPFNLIATAGAYSFSPRLMANHSAEHPDGRLYGEVLKSFFAVSGAEGDFKYKEGHERIPDNWYRRSLLAPYTLLNLLEDFSTAARRNPNIVAIGGNTGQINSFTLADVGNLTFGAYNTRNLRKGNNFACFAFQFFQAAPNFLETLGFIVFALVDRTFLTFLDAVGFNVSRTLSCPTLERYDVIALKNFPGFNRSLNDNKQ